MSHTPEYNDNTLITVCASCLKASCWNYAFVCNDYKNSGTTQKPVSELKKLGLESSDYWEQQILGDEE